MKILVSLPCGLNDSFSALAYLIDLCVRIKIPYNSIYIWTGYRDILQLIDIEHINFLAEPPNLQNFDMIYTYCYGEQTNLNIGNDKHLSNFVKPKLSLIQEFIQYQNTNTEAVHFRMWRTELGELSLEEEMHIYIEKLKNIYRPEKEYLVFFDHPAFGDQLFLQKENIKLRPPMPPIDDNLDLAIPLYSSLQRDMLRPRIFLDKDSNKRIKYNLNLIKDVYLMSLCKVIHKTMGNFTSLTKIFNPSNHIVYL